jgi:hypothetical protein
MIFESHYHGCTAESVRAIHPGLPGDVASILRMLPRRTSESELRQDLFWLFTHKGFCHDRIPVGTPEECPFDLDILDSLAELDDYRSRDLCLASTAFDTLWHADFAKAFGDRLVHVKAQFGRLDALFKDFCGFRIGQVQRGIALGIEIVPMDAGTLFGTAKSAGGAMADFAGARKILEALDIPLSIWLIGIGF